MTLDVLSVTSEIYPLVKTGGLADVTGALPRALAAEDVNVRTLVPGYPAVLDALSQARRLFADEDLFGGPASVLAASTAGLDLIVIDAPHLFRRPGNPYLQADGTDWPDNAFRFAALAWVASQIGQGKLRAWRPDVIHAHDWQAGLAAAYLRYHGNPRPPTVFTIHNLAFQGRFPAALLQALRLPDHAYDIEGLEYHGDVSFLKAGLRFADRITTVSPNYAAEICTPEHGMGLDGLLRTRQPVLTGIVNGLDTEVWNPATDAHIPARYKSGSVRRRLENKAALQARFGLTADATIPLFGQISRLSDQKGVDLLLEAVPTLVGEGAQLVIVGTGDRTQEEEVEQAAAAYPGQVGAFIGYDEPLAHLVQAGADVLLVPSRFEPCGLTQLAALRYGAVPVVARVGGLSDTIIDASPAALAAGCATGIQFSPRTQGALANAIRRAIELYRQPELWRRLQKNGMASDVSWRQPAAEYARIYRELAGRS